MAVEELAGVAELQRERPETDHPLADHHQEDHRYPLYQGGLQSHLAADRDRHHHRLHLNRHRLQAADHHPEPLQRKHFLPRTPPRTQQPSGW